MNKNLLVLYEYHIQLSGTLRCDLGEDKAGYTGKLTRDLMKHFNTTDWRQAYSKAAAYHEERANELSGGLGWQEFMGSHYHGEFERECTDFIDKHINLGREPKSL